MNLSHEVTMLIKARIDDKDPYIGPNNCNDLAADKLEKLVVWLADKAEELYDKDISKPTPQPGKSK